MSQMTKRALAASLKKLLAHKPLDKITVVDVTTDCGVNRQTFYYHFQDIYDLIEWIYTSEAEQALGGKKGAASWEEGLLHVCAYALENRAFVIGTYHSVSREHLEQHLYQRIFPLIWDVIEENAKDIAVSEEDKIFIANFYQFAFVGLLLNWVGGGMRDDPALLVARLARLVRGNIADALACFRADTP